MTVLITNNATSRLAGALTAAATTLSVTAGEGAKFPAPTAGNWCPITLINAAGGIEVLRCTARSGDVLTVARGQEGTPAAAFAAGDRVELRLTAAVIADLYAEMADVRADTAASVTALNLPGMIVPFGRTSAPAGWLKCNGTAVSRATYAALFASIGTTFGAGDGSTTFNLPELRGEHIRGLDDARGVDAGRTIGSAQAAQLLTHTHTGSTSSDSHNHTFSGTSSTAGAHVHGVGLGGSGDITPGTSANAVMGHTDSVRTYKNFTNSVGDHSHTYSGTVSTDAHTHTFTTAAAGGAEQRVRTIALLYCIKT